VTILVSVIYNVCLLVRRALDHKKWEINTNNRSVFISRDLQNYPVPGHSRYR